MSQEMILLPKEKYDKLLEEHRKIGENIIKSETNDVSVQAGGGATVDKPIVEVDRLGGGNTRDDSENSIHIPIREQVSDSADDIRRLHVKVVEKSTF